MRPTKSDLSTKDNAVIPEKGCAQAQAKINGIEGLMTLMAHSPERAVVFEIDARPDSRVYLAGSFNNWNPTSHPLTYHPESGLFRETLLLPPGQHEYKFVIDGVWTLDSKTGSCVFTASGIVNNMVKV
jgi:1,4-alpha-glucan branching enzyme